MNVEQKTELKELAHEFIAGRSLIHHQGRTLIYNRTNYVEETALAKKVRCWLMNNGHPHNTYTVSNVVACIEAITLVEYPSLPFYFGTGDFPKSVIAYRNGLLDVEAYIRGKRELIPHTSDWISTSCLPFDFDPAATSPGYDKFLDWALDKEYQDLWHEWCGYCLTPDTSQQKFLIKYGPTGSGKGTTDSILGAIIGEGNSTGFYLSSFVTNSRFACTDLVGKAVAFIGETDLPKNDRQIIVERLKSITGGDLQRIERKGSNEFQNVVLPTRFIVSCNAMPKWIDTTAALSRRMLLIRFNRSVSHEKQDGKLYDKLSGELPGINNRFLDGLVRLRQQARFSEPKDMQERKAELVRESSPILAFIQDNLCVEKRLDTGTLSGVQFSETPLSCTSRELRAAFRDWYPENDNGTDHDKAFRFLMSDLKDLMPDCKDRKKRDAEGWFREYSGIAIRRP